APDFGSITEGSTGEDAPDLGSITGSLSTIITGSVDALNAGSSNLGSGDVIVDGSLPESGSGAGSDAGTLLALGSLAGAGIGLGLVVSGGVNLPPLPEINVGLVCNLPPEAIDFLKSNGSMEQDECEPEEEQN
ncbi:hypothetical protein QNA14_10735, partial [Dietzia kunjamensis]